MGKGKIPDDLHQHLRMPMIESGAGGKEFLLHFGLQKSPIFLLDDPASRAAQFFASATDADKLMQMQKAHQQKAINAKRDKEKLDGEVEQLDRQLEALSPLPILSKGLNDLEDDHRKLNELATAIGSIGQSVQAMERVEKHVAVNGLQIRSLASLQNPPTLADTQKLTEWIRQTERSISDAALSHARGETLRDSTNHQTYRRRSRSREFATILRRRRRVSHWNGAGLMPLSRSPRHRSHTMFRRLERPLGTSPGQKNSMPNGMGVSRLSLRSRCPRYWLIPRN